MSFFELANLAEAADAAWHKEPANSETVAAGISTDTRTIRRGDLFIALHGPNHDGHDHLEEAAQKGASCLLVTRPEKAPLSVPCAVVRDTRRALLTMAAAFRATLRDTTVIAVTGSNGKTTTVRCIESVLSQAGRTHASPKSFNNEIGMPLTVLSTPADAQFLVCEIGMNAPGEIEPLASTLRPDIGVITSIGTAHIEALGSREAIAHEKATLLQHLRDATSIAFVPANEPALAPSLRAVQNLFTVGTKVGADTHIQHVETHIESDGATTQFEIDQQRYSIPLAGAHNATNASFAVAVARHLGLEEDLIRVGLERVVAPQDRLALREYGGVTLVNDAYNANPESMLAALTVFIKVAQSGSRRVLVIGEMAEQGDQALSSHRELAERIVNIAEPHEITTVGRSARATHERLLELAPDLSANHLDRLTDEDAHTIARSFRAGDTVLLKGSRTNTLERIERALDDLTHADAPCSTA